MILKFAQERINIIFNDDNGYKCYKNQSKTNSYSMLNSFLHHICSVYVHPSSPFGNHSQTTKYTLQDAMNKQDIISTPQRA